MVKWPTPGIWLKPRRILAVTGLIAVVATVAAVALWLMHPAAPQTPTKVAQSPGSRVFDKWCSDCHRTATGPGSMALERRYRGQVPAILEQRADIQPDLVKYVVRHGQSFMPPFRKTEISDADLVMLADYLGPSSARSHASTNGPASIDEPSK